MKAPVYIVYIVAYLWIGCVAAAWCARHDLKPEPGSKEDYRALAVFVLLGWPLYAGIKSAGFVIDHIPTSACGPAKD